MKLLFTVRSFENDETSLMDQLLMVA